MVLERVVAWVLTKYLGDYIEDLNSKSLKLSLLKGSLLYSLAYSMTDTSYPRSHRLHRTIHSRTHVPRNQAVFYQLCYD